MTKASAGKPSRGGANPSTGVLPKSRAGRTKAVPQESDTGQFMVSKARVKAVMTAAERTGLLNEKNSRIGGRVSSALVKQAKRQTGIETDTDLIEFALATVALEDNFAATFKESRGKVDARQKLGF